MLKNYCNPITHATPIQGSMVIMGTSQIHGGEIIPHPNPDDEGA